jgi:hypothetical protein
MKMVIKGPESKRKPKGKRRKRNAPLPCPPLERPIKWHNGGAPDCRPTWNENGSEFVVVFDVDDDDDRWYWKDLPKNWIDCTCVLTDLTEQTDL